MSRSRIISADGKALIDQEDGPNDRVNIGKGASIISEPVYDKLIDAAGSEDELHASLGVLTSDYSSMPLPKLKTFWKRMVQKQAEVAFGEKWSIFEVCVGIKAGSGKPAYDNMMADAASYKAALKTAKDAIEACTTNDQVVAISFVASA